MKYLNAFFKKIGLDKLNSKGKVYNEKELKLYRSTEIKAEVLPEIIKNSTVFENIKDTIENFEQVLNYIN